MALQLTAEQLEEIQRHALAAHPEECCGLLLGRAAAEDGRVLAVLRAANLHPRRHRSYRLDSAALCRALRAERRGGPAVLGVYHSHPRGEAWPSSSDRRDAWPGWRYVIVAAPPAAVRRRAFRVDTRGAWGEEAIVIAAGPLVATGALSVAAERAG